MRELDVDDLMAFSEKMFGSKPRLHQLEVIKQAAEGNKVTVLHFQRATGKTWAINLWQEYNKYIKEMKK